MTVLDATAGAELTTRVVEGRLRTTLYLDGELCHRTAAVLRDALRDACDRAPRNVVVDCAGVTAVTDVAGLAPVVAAMHDAHRRDGRLWLADPAGPVVDGLRRAHLARVVDTGTPLAELVTS
ncbi:MAG TPA: STAS domain-containing protein [Frankiaceae bacterium]|nr:STAS domain-containing protein [Frankiaceae bacterium]